MSSGRGIELSIAIGAYASAAVLHLGLLAAVVQFGGGSGHAVAAGRIDLVTLPPPAAVTVASAAITARAPSGDAATTVAAVAPARRISSARPGGGLLTLLPTDAAEPTSAPAVPVHAVAPVATGTRLEATPAEPSRPDALAAAIASSPSIPTRPLAETRDASTPESSSASRSTIRPFTVDPASAVRTATRILVSEAVPSNAPSPTEAFGRPSTPAAIRAATVATSQPATIRTHRSPAPIRHRGQTEVAAVRNAAGPIASGASGPVSSQPGSKLPEPSAGAAIARPLGPTAGRAVAPSPQVAAIAPRAASQASGATGAIGGTGAGREVRDFLRLYGGGGCFIAVASQVDGDRFAVSGFSRTEAEWTAFNRALDARTGYRFTSGSRQVSEAQCAALAFARRQPAYPAFETRISLESDRLASGAEIAGTIVAPPGRRLTLLLVDDEGRVQDVTKLLRPASGDGGMTFSTPLTLTSGPVATVQLFVAVADEGAIDAVPADGSLMAADYFASLAKAVESRKEGVDVALAAFSVE